MWLPYVSAQKLLLVLAAYGGQRFRGLPFPAGVFPERLCLRIVGDVVRRIGGTWHSDARSCRPWWRWEQKRFAVCGEQSMWPGNRHIEPVRGVVKQ